MNMKANEIINKVLEDYKNGSVSLEEAESRIEVIIADKEIEKGIDWKDDNSIRIAVFRGRRLIRHSMRDDSRCEITFSGDPVDVYCDHGLTVKGNVAGTVRCGHGFTCSGSVGGDVTAGHAVSCGDVKQGVKAGHGVNCGNIGGNINCGHGVHCTGRH